MFSTVLVETTPDVLSPVKLVQHLLKVHIGEYLSPCGGTTKQQAKDLFYKKFRSFMDFFIRKTVEVHKWNGNELGIVWHHLRVTMVGILEKFPEISQYRTKIQMGYRLNPTTTNDTYLFNALKSPGFDSTFEENVLPFLTVTTAEVRREVEAFFQIQIHLSEQICLLSTPPGGNE